MQNSATTVQTGSRSSRTPEQFEADFDSLITHIENVTKGKAPGDTGEHTGWFPNFRLSDVIKEKLETATLLFGEGDLGKAFEVLRNARQHFDNQQAAYVRNIAKGLQDQLHRMYQAVPAHELTKLKEAANVAVGDLCDYILDREFESRAEASVKCWAAIESLEAVRQAFDNLPAAQELERAQQREERARQERAAHRQRLVARLSAVSQRLSKKFDRLKGGTDSMTTTVDSDEANASDSSSAAAA